MSCLPAQLCSDYLAVEQQDAVTSALQKHALVHLRKQARSLILPVDLQSALNSLRTTTHTANTAPISHKLSLNSQHVHSLGHRGTNAKPCLEAALREVHIYLLCKHSFAGCSCRWAGTGERGWCQRAARFTKPSGLSTDLHVAGAAPVA